MPETFDEFAPVKAVKAQVKLKLGIAGPSGSGKTDGALALATAFGASEDKTKKPKILVVDTENRSASLYADRYDFDTIPLRAPYTPERYKKAMQKAVEGGYDWLIVDSITQEWNGDGGILRRKEKFDLVPNSNSYTNWGKVTPDHESFVEFIKQIPVHTICTMRSKQAYVLEADGRGKQKPRKLGMEPLQRDGVEYEFTLVFDLDMQHAATPTKNRTTLFSDDPVNLRDREVAEQLRKWLEAGAKEVRPEWHPDLGTVHVTASGREVPVDRAEQRPQPIRADRPVLITVDQKTQFWTVLRKDKNKTNDDVREWLWTRFKVSTSAEIPAESFVEAIEWAKTPLPERKYAPGEEKARDTAKLMSVSEADLQYELATCRGDWEQVYTILSQRQEAIDAAVEEMRVSGELEQMRQHVEKPNPKKKAS